MSFVAALATAIGEAATAGLVGMGVGAGTAATAGGIAGGIGAGALTGSALGAGGAALTGQDVGEGAGLGALTGAIGGGLTSGLGALGSEAGTTLGTESLASQTSAAIPTTESVGSASQVPTTQGINALSASRGAEALTPTFESAPAMNAPTYTGIGSAPIGGTQAVMNAVDTGGTAGSNIIGNTQPLSTSEKIGNWVNANKGITAGGIGLGSNLAINSMMAPSIPTAPNIKNPTIDPNKYKYTQPRWSVYQPTYMAAGGLTDVDGYMADAQNTPQDVQVPNMKDVANPVGYLGNSVQAYAHGGIADLGSYSAGGKPNLLHGAGDGVSDDIPATIGGKQPARLAAGEYVVPSRIVSELGNGSTDAGAQRLDEMVKRIQAGRHKTLKGKDYAKDTKAYKHLPA